MHHTRFALGLLATALWLTGCSGPLVRNAPDAEAPADFPNHSALQIVQQVTTSTDGLTAFSSEARVQIESPSLSQSIGASLRASLTDSVYASLRGPLSISVGRGLVTADSFLAYDRLNRRFYLGTLAMADRYVPGAGEPGMLARTLIGHLVPEIEVPWQVTPNAATYVLTEPGTEVRRRYTVDPALWRVTAYEELAPDGTVLNRRTFTAFDVIEGLVAPRQITLASPPSASEIVIEHRRLILNPDDLTFPFQRPSDVETIRLD
ncbi:MAG: DUF4292 domain-containing protein [Rhodothermaceae bacterium]|nr:DUF4292 domain-containing protein [Rhodothermaceae bacterium]